jgi:hypothetical protein
MDLENIQIVNDITSMSGALFIAAPKEHVQKYPYKYARIVGVYETLLVDILFCA